MQRQRGQRGANGGGANGATEQQAAAQQLLLSLLGGAFSGAQRGGKNGGRGQSSAGQRRAGEWACSCGFQTNRPSRDNCFVCSRPREAGGGQSKGLGKKGAGKGSARPATAPARNAPAGRGGERRYDGPIGANGSRPLLGGRGQNPHRDGTDARAGSPGKGGAWGEVQGKAPGKGSAAAWMGDAGAAGKGPADHVHEPGGKGVRGNGKGTGKWVRPPLVADDEGFTLVQPRRMYCKGGASGSDLQLSTDGGTTTTGGGDGGNRETRPRWADEDDSDADDDAYMDDDRYEDDGGDHGGAQETQCADPKELKAEYDELAKAVRDMERQGRFAQNGLAIRALREARDRAEQEWRGAKAPPPLPTRLAQAEAKLAKARQALENARVALETFDEQADKQRAALAGNIDEAEAWHRWRQDQVDELHAEAGERAPNWRQPAGTAGSDEVRERIREQFLPELQTIIEHVAGNPEVVDRLSVLAAGLAEAEGRLETSISDRTQTFDLAGDDGPTEDGNCDNRGLGWPGGGAGRGGGDDGSTTRAVGWKPEGQGRWARAAAAQQTPSGGGTSASSGTARATGEEEPQAKSDGDHEDEKGPGESPAKSRKCNDASEQQAEARAAADRQRALELLQQQKAAEEAQLASYNHGQGGFGSQAALSLAAQKFVLEVRRVEARAAKRGIEAKHDDGRQLLELSPMELDEWASAKLADDDEHL